jgi:O-antigen/teichoic acid export membrane protein
LLNVVFTLGLQYLTVLQRSTTVLAISTLRTVVYLSLGALFVGLLGMGVFGALLGILLTNALAFVGLTLPLLVRIGLRFSMAKFVSLLSFGAPLLPGQMAELLVKFSDRYLLVHLASLASAGVFFLGLRLSAILQMAIVAPFNQIYIVRRFEAYGGNVDDSDASRVFTYFFAVIVTGALGLSLMAPQLIALIAFRRPEYEGAASVIPLLALAEVVRSVLLILELGIFYAKIPRYLTFANLAGLLVHVPLTAILITLWGVLGAAAAVCVSTTVRLIVTRRLARGLHGPEPQWGSLLTMVSAGVAVFGMAWAIELTLGSVWGAIGRIFLAVSFPLLLLLSPVFSAEEREALRCFVANRLSPPKDGRSRRVTQ